MITVFKVTTFVKNAAIWISATSCIDRRNCSMNRFDVHGESVSIDCSLELDVMAQLLFVYLYSPSMACSRENFTFTLPSRMWQYVVGWVVPDVSKTKRNAFILKSKSAWPTTTKAVQSFRNVWDHSPNDMPHVFSNTSVKTSHLTSNNYILSVFFLYALYTIRLSYSLTPLVPTVFGSRL
jgi:hypothetical protein